ncbi:MAG: hypothetical protein ABII07_05215 [Patescibacteria group bacterium]|nr:hypothetical protein [Patescibacteria group bacterium]
MPPDFEEVDTISEATALKVRLKNSYLTEKDPNPHIEIDSFTVSPEHANTRFIRLDVMEGCCFAVNISDVQEAIDICLEFNDYENAGSLCETSGDHVRAAEVYEEGRCFYKAARTSREMGDFLRAMKNSEKRGNFRDAMMQARRIKDVKERVYEQLAELLQPR